MSLPTKKFLDSAGTTALWQRIIAELATKGRVDTISAADNSVTVGGTASAATIAVKLSPKTGNSLSILTAQGEEGLYVNAPASTVYSMVKDTQAETGFAATYHLTADGTNTGVSINIPKDMVISSGTVETKSASGAWGNAGTYLHLVLANADNTDFYINVEDLIEYVTSGSQAGDMVFITIDANNQVTATITDGTITAAKLHTDVQAALTKAGTALQQADITSGATNGTIAVKGTDVAVTGLGTAAYAATTDFDAAGDATAVYNAIIALTTNEIDAAIAAANNNP